MKNLVLIPAFLFISLAIISCKKSPAVKPVNSNASKPDTNTTLISNTELVGNWNIVTDSVSTNGDTTYYGTPADHYIFTKYANLYIKNAFEDNLTDTAVYTIAVIPHFRG